jgi:hypothetical protein
MRHPKEGAPYVASQNATIPVINAGDGGHCHPTQTLADLLTISREKGRLNDLTVGFCGDLKYGRTVHSLIAALSRYTGIKIVLISPEELKLPGYVKYNILEKNNINPETDVKINFVSSEDLVAKLVKGEAEVALAPEPAATTVISKNPALNRVLSINDEWKKVSDTQLMMGCVIALDSYVNENPAAVNIRKLYFSAGGKKNLPVFSGPAGFG